MATIIELYRLPRIWCLSRGIATTPKSNLLKQIPVLYMFGLVGVEEHCMYTRTSHECAMCCYGQPALLLRLGYWYLESRVFAFIREHSFALSYSNTQG